MSWSNYTVGKSDQIVDRVNALTTPAAETFPPTADQLKAAKAVALSLIESAAVGVDDTGAFQVTISGHANENHAPAAGNADEVINVSVARVPEAAVSAFDQNVAATQRNQE